MTIFAYIDGFKIFSFLVVLPIALFLMFFWIWALVDAIRNRSLGDGEKIGWVLAIIFFHILGSLLYYFIGRRRT